MNKVFIFLIIVFTGCTLPAEKKANEAAREMAQKQEPITTITTNDTNAANKPLPLSPKLPVIQKIKKPSGIYQSNSPINGNMQQTIAFYNDYSFHLEEKYNSNKKDSIVITEGTWSPSDGYIWLYKDQVVRGRYSWKDDTLQYYSPSLKSKYTMQPLKNVLENKVWKNKKEEGMVAFGIGTEPFWSVEFTNKDTLSFLLSEWKHPLKIKIGSSFKTKDSSGYTAQNDTAHLRLTIFPYFCSDGMSDFIYPNKIKVQYNHKTYNGCGVLYQ